MNIKEGLRHPRETIRDGIHQLRSPLYRNAIILLSISVTIAIASFIYWAVVARYYSSFDVGIAAALVSASGLLSLVATLGFDLGLIRFLPQAKDVKGMINSCLTISGLAAILLAIVFVLGLPLWSPDLLILRQLLPLGLFIVATVAGVISYLQVQVFTAMRSPEYTWIQQMIFSVLRIPLVIVLVEFGTVGVWASWTIALTLGVVIGNVFLFKVSPGYCPALNIDRKVTSVMARFTSGNYLANLAITAPIYILPLMVVATLGAAQNAYFYIGFRIGAMLFNFAVLVATSLFVEGSHTPDKIRALSSRSTVFTFALLVPALAVCLIFGREILLLFGQEYAQSALWIFWLIAFSAIPFTLNETYLTVRRVQLKVKNIIYFSVSLAIVVLSAAYLLLINIGVTGAGLGWLAGQSIFALGVIWWLRSALSKKRQLSNINKVD